MDALRHARPDAVLRTDVSDRADRNPITGRTSMRCHRELDGGELERARADPSQRRSLRRRGGCQVVPDRAR